jgi:hypothetical protein
VRPPFTLSPLLLFLLSLLSLLPGCTVVHYQHDTVKVDVIYFAVDRRADAGYVRLADGSVLNLSGFQSNPNAATVQILAGAAIRALMLIP